ncbi:MAG TPA: alpha-galactosidase [Kineosporiaceae bacterium]|nr:alpha-galactosidase [Kineosporiaceae bacterium]
MPPEHQVPFNAKGSLVQLRSAEVALLVDCRGSGLPVILHWGADPGVLDDAELTALALVARPAVVPNALDEPHPVAVLPEHSGGWMGLPGLQGHRSGRDWSTQFTVDGVECVTAPEGGGALRVTASDSAAALELRLDLELTPSGLVRVEATVHNCGTDDYTLDGLVLALPLPDTATELLELTGRWGRERSPQRRPFGVSTHVRDSRRGRTGSDSTLLLVAGEAGFGFRSGQVWGVHVGWSGNHRTYAERLPSGEAVIGGGELLLSGEIRLGPGESYSTPVVHAVHGTGLDDLSHRFASYLRARPGHPSGPRPVIMNTWEAVYFDQNLERLAELAELGAKIGAELFVLDDGWFLGRRDDTRGLGDWFVDPDVWPQGLHLVVERVRALGMRFGLWVEPEMVNPDSDLARAHPDWILATGDRRPPLVRGQLVLDLTRPEAFEYLLERLDALVTEYHLDYLKWDHNRDLVDAGASVGGGAAVHAQTLAVYALLDTLRQRHPGLEIESCSSGGARVDLGVLARTDRVWASDCIDALERQAIQRWTGLLLPPELIGSHVGAPRSHTTGRRHDLSFRAGTALFGHFGIEWDLSAADQTELADLAEWVAFYRRHRDWLHRGRVVRVDSPDPATLVHGIVADDGHRALFAVVQLASSVTVAASRIRLPGLSPEARFTVRPATPGGTPATTALRPVPWLATGVTLSGRALAEIGLQAPPLQPEQLLLLDVQQEPDA